MFPYHSVPSFREEFCQKPNGKDEFLESDCVFGDAYTLRPTTIYPGPTTPTLVSVVTVFRWGIKVHQILVGAPFKYVTLVESVLFPCFCLKGPTSAVSLRSSVVYRGTQRKYVSWTSLGKRYRVRGVDADV